MLTLTPELVKTNNIVVVKDKVAADAFFGEIFTLYANVIVYSCDEFYPTNSVIRDNVVAALNNNIKTSVVVFNYDCLNLVTIKTDRVLILDDILIESFFVHNAYINNRVEADARLIATLMESFFRQKSAMERVNDFTNHYLNFPEYSDDHSDWRFKLLVGTSNTDLDQ